MEDEKKKKRKRMPARTPEGRENQLIGLAVDLAEKKLLDGSASSQLICLLLNLATTKAKLELEKLKSDVNLSNAKVTSLENQESSKDLYAQAIEAFKTYSGQNNVDDEYDD